MTLLLDGMTMIGGFFLLILGAQGLVKGSASMAIRYGLPPLFVGLTIVAIGTSTPELVVSLGSALQGKGDVSVGNIVGSNIFNIAVILGLTAMITPIKVSYSIIKFDIPVMIAVSFAAALLFNVSETSRIMGIVLIFSLFAYFAATLYLARKEAQQSPAGEANMVSYEHTSSSFIDVGFILGGILILILGSQLVVSAATAIAVSLGVSNAVIGLTIIGMGTSIPELAASIVAAVKKQPDMAIGNVVGSNIFNILGVLGFSSLLTPLTAPGVRLTDWAAMIFLALLLLPLAWTAKTLDRREGLLFLLIYILYIWWLWASI